MEHGLPLFLKLLYQIKDKMANRYYIIALILTFLWMTGYLYFELGSYIHILLGAAFLLIFSRIIREE
jgi:hypothetical protein